ncbi:MAG: hypothetical protein AB7W16_00055 [Candidatus Obscuribacterales bacterium]
MNEIEKQALLNAADHAARFAAAAFARLDDIDETSTYARARRRFEEHFVPGVREAQRLTNGETVSASDLENALALLSRSR